jgi:hypothetical protein
MENGKPERLKNRKTGISYSGIKIPFLCILCAHIQYKLERNEASSYMRNLENQALLCMDR